MDLKKIRDMDDDELSVYLKSLMIRKTTNCYKCGKENSPYTINIQNKREQQQKKLCSLCENCYKELLNYLSIEDILWDTYLK